MEEVYIRAIHLQPLDEHGKPKGLPKRIPGTNMAQAIAQDVDRTLSQVQVPTLVTKAKTFSWEVRMEVDKFIRLYEWFTGTVGYQDSLDSWESEGGACGPAR